MPQPLSNLLIDRLPPAERNRLLKRATPVGLPLNSTLQEQGTPPQFVYFITSGMVSMVTEMSTGEGVEVGLVCREGLTSSFSLLGPSVHGTTRTFMQVAGTGLRMDFRDFESEFLSNPAVAKLVLRYVQYQSFILSQLAACNRVHEVEERLARWLLMVDDRIGQPVIPLTQEFLATMLGTRRSTVTIVAGTLQRSGSIEYHRGQVTIVNRERLEASACECYEVTRRLLQALYT